MKFLMGLNDSFSQVRTPVLLMDPLPSLNKVYALLIQEEMQRTMTEDPSTHVESTILAAKTQNFTTDSENNHNEKDRTICVHCDKLGHTSDMCYKLHGFPPRFRFKNKPPKAHQVSSTQVKESVPFVLSIQNHPNFTSEQYQQLLALIGTPSSPLGSTFEGKEVPMANMVASSSTWLMVAIYFVLCAFVNHYFFYYTVYSTIV